MKVFWSIAFLLLVACDNKFEPDLSGWKVNSLPGSTKIRMDMNGREKTVTLPGDTSVIYRYPQWTRSQHEILMVQIYDVDECLRFRIVGADTTGVIIDTIYSAPPNTAINFKLAPNDSLLLVKSYDDDCTTSGNYKYSFFNRYTKEPLPDTILVEDARGILMRETVWSPDSRKVVIQDRGSIGTKGFAYDLETKEQRPIDMGKNFVWSPADPQGVAYIKDYSIYMWNWETGEKKVFFEGKSVKEVMDFRWDPIGEFMMIHIKGYLLNMEAGPFQNESIVYVSMKDRTPSEAYRFSERVDTWKK
jgi:hypothetical protein